MKKILLFLLGAIIFLGVYILGYSAEVEKDLTSNIIRLHIVANSDSDSDQELKLKVRDEIIKEMQQNKNINNISQSRDYIKNNLNGFEDIARKVIKQNCFNYDVCAIFDNSTFPVKRYGSVVLPAGEYEALKIIIGEGAGHNWWCVMFPPLCLTDESKAEFSKDSEKILKDNLTNEVYELIHENGDIEFDIRFKFLDLFGGITKSS